MQRRSNILASSLITLLSIITIVLQFIVYYFFAAFYVIWGVSILVCLLSCYILQEQTSSYEACFNYSVLTLFISSLVIALSYLGKEQSFLPYTGIMLGIAFINWFIPSIHCFIRNIVDYGTRFEDYDSFFLHDSLLFFLVYIGVILYGSFAPAAFPWAYTGTLNYANFIPFDAITLQIEDYLYGLLPLRNIVIYLLCRILLYLPYGFQMALILRRNGRLLKYIALLVLPLLLEIFQYILIPSRFDIDDVIYAVLGGILGTLLYYLCNMIFRAMTGKNFLSKRNGNPYSNSRLHF